MQAESMPLQRFIDIFFKQPHSYIYSRPDMPYWTRNKVDVWDTVVLPGAIAIYRRSQFKNMDEGYGDAKPVLVIHKKPECTNRTY